MKAHALTYTVIGLILLSSVSANHAEPAEVIHIPQAHASASVADETKDKVDWIAKWQHQQAIYLSKHPDDIVIKEGLPQALTPEVFANPDDEKKALIKYAQELFPDGIAENYDELNLAQKEFLAGVGGAETLFFLGLRKNVTKASIFKEDNTVFDRIDELNRKYEGRPDLAEQDPEYQRLVFATREMMAKKSVLQEVERPENRGKKIFLVYGAFHDFESYFEDTPGVRFSREESFDRLPMKPRDPGDPTTLEQDKDDLLESMASSKREEISIESEENFRKQIQIPYGTLSAELSRFLDRARKDLENEEKLTEQRLAELASWGRMILRDLDRFQGKVDEAGPGIPKALRRHYRNVLSDLDTMRQSLDLMRIRIRDTAIAKFGNGLKKDRVGFLTNLEESPLASSAGSASLAPGSLKILDEPLEQASEVRIETADLWGKTAKPISRRWENSLQNVLKKTTEVAKTPKDSKSIELKPEPALTTQDISIEVTIKSSISEVPKSAEAQTQSIMASIPSYSPPQNNISLGNQVTLSPNFNFGGLESDKKVEGTSICLSCSNPD